MPAIMRNKEQDDALNKINALLKDISNCNETYRNADAHYTLADGKRKIAVSEELNERLKAVIKEHRRRLIKDVGALCSKYKIELDSNEKKLISSDALTEEKATPAAAEPEAAAQEDEDPFADL